MHTIIIAIDGYSSCGKSTTAKKVAAKLGYTYIDTGAMYRAVTLYFINHRVSLTNPKDVSKALDNISIELLQKGDALAPQEPWASMENTGEW